MEQDAQDWVAGRETVSPLGTEVDAARAALGEAREKLEEVLKRVEEKFGDEPDVEVESAVP